METLQLIRDNLTWDISLILTIAALLFYMYLGYKRPGIAMITSVFVSIGMAYGANLMMQYDLMVINLFIFPVTIMAVLFSKPEIEANEWPRFIAELILIASLLLFIMISGFILGGPLGFYGIILVIFIAGGLISVGLTSHYATAAYVISTIGASMRQNLPLAMALETAASGQNDKRAIILRRIKKWLVQGYSLSESIKRGYSKCPAPAVAMIAAAERINQLPLAINAIEEDIVSRADQSRKVQPIHPLYPVILITFMFFVLFFLLKFVIPQIKTVYEELFGQGLPALSRSIFEIGNFLVWRIPEIIWLILAIIIALAIPVAIGFKFRPRRADRPYLISRAFDFIKWHLPVLHWFENNYSMVQAIEILRLSLNAGEPVNTAIANSAGLDVNNCFRKQLLSWHEKIERGENISESAQQSGLGHTLAWAFDERVNQGNTLSILEMLEGFYRSNYSYRVNLARFIMWPCVTIIMGVMVGFVVYAVFSPLVELINNLVSQVIP